MANMMNNGIVEGILAEIDLQERVWNNSDVISGKVVVRVKAPVVKNGPVVECDVPVSFFSKKLTSNGGVNPSYSDLNTILHEGKSIAAVGIEQADAVRLTSVRVTMNEYYGRDGRFISFPRVNGSFIRIIPKTQMNPTAKVDMDFIIRDMKHETDKDGIETGRFFINGINIGFNDYTDIIPIVTENPEYISSIEAVYQPGDAITASVRLNFSQKTETTYQEVEIGDPIERTRTITVSDLVIAAINRNNRLIEMYSSEQVKSALEKRNQRIENKKISGQKAATTERTQNVAQSRIDLGF